VDPEHHVCSPVADAVLVGVGIPIEGGFAVNSLPAAVRASIGNRLPPRAPFGESAGDVRWFAAQGGRRLAAAGGSAQRRVEEMPGQGARKEVTKPMTVPLSLRNAPTVRQRKVSDTRP